MRNKNYQTLKADDDFSDIDHIIIGSGIGGLTTATWLAKAGKKVVVFERHYVPGGFTHSFKRKLGFQWDVGVHYVGNVGEQDSLRPFFDYLTERKLEWDYMGDVYDVSYINGKRYEFRAGKEQLAKGLISYFPEEREAITTYIELIEKANSRSSAFFLEKVFEPILSKTIGHFIRKRFQKLASRTTYDVLSSLTNNETLIAVLCSQCGNYGLTPKESSFAAHALIVGHFMLGGYYPKGGADQIAEKTIDTINSLGGRVYINAKVSNIVTKDGNVQGITVNDTFVKCNSVISNVGIQNTYKHLLNDTERAQLGFNIDSAQPAVSHVCLYVGLNADSATLNLPKYNIWYYDNINIDSIINTATPNNAANNFAYISFPSAKDAHWDKEHPNTATIQAITVGNYDWFKAFEDQPWRNRDEDYKAMKAKFKEQLLDQLYKLYPQIKGHVVVTEVSTPLSTKHFSNYKHGEIYGLAHTLKRFSLPYLRPKTKIKGLYLTGQDITCVGVGGAMMSGVLCATSILKLKSWKNFKDMNSYKIVAED